MPVRANVNIDLNDLLYAITKDLPEEWQLPEVRGRNRRRDEKEAKKLRAELDKRQRRRDNSQARSEHKLNAYTAYAAKGIPHEMAYAAIEGGRYDPDRRPETELAAMTGPDWYKKRKEAALAKNPRELKVGAANFLGEAVKNDPRLRDIIDKAGGPNSPGAIEAVVNFSINNPMAAPTNLTPKQAKEMAGFWKSHPETTASIVGKRRQVTPETLGTVRRRTSTQPAVSKPEKKELTWATANKRQGALTQMRQAILKPYTVKGTHYEYMAKIPKKFYNQLVILNIPLIAKALGISEEAVMGWLPLFPIEQEQQALADQVEGKAAGPGMGQMLPHAGGMLGRLLKSQLWGTDAEFTEPPPKEWK